MSEANVNGTLPPRIGERTLSDGNLKLVLPNDEDVYTLVEQIRDRTPAIILNQKPEKVDSNNVIGILGERGSGKSSVLLTVREELKKKKNGERDIFLNMIVPEMLEDSSDILGVVLLNFNTYIEEHREKILDYYRSQRQMSGSQQAKGTAFDNCLYIDKTTLDNLWNKVFTAYVYRTKNLQKVVEENFAGVAHFKEERKEALGSELELRERLQDFFDEIIKIWRDQNENAPLVFICFDDADLNPKRCYEVLNIILKYLNHPNIVTFISGDILKFEEDIVGELLQQQNLGLLNEKLVPERTVLESQQELVYDFLKKIMPYSQRFSLKKLSAQDKMNFKVSDDGEGIISFKQILDRSFEEGKAPYVCEDLKKRDEGGVDAPLLFDIFDSKPRGLLTLYSYLSGEERFDFDQTNGTRDKDNQRDSMMLLAYYQKLFEMVLETNSTLRKHKKWIETLFTMNIKTDLSGISVDIYHNRFQFEASRDIERTNKWREEMITIVHFLYFVESMITRNVTSISGRMYQQDLQNSIGMAKDQSLLPRIQNARIIFALYSKLSIDFNIEQMKDVFNKKSYTNRYKELIEDYFEDDYESLFAEDTVWLQNYEQITKEKGFELFAIKNKIVEEFLGFNFDLDILDNLNFYEELILKRPDFKRWGLRNQQEVENELNNSREMSIKERQERRDELSVKFKDLSLYSFLLRMTGGKGGEKAKFDPEWSVTLKKKLRAIDTIMYKNQYVMNLKNISEFEKAHIKDFTRSNDEYFDIENAKKKLTALVGFLKEEIKIYIKTRSRNNEKILKKRIGGIIEVTYENADEAKYILKEESSLEETEVNEVFNFNMKSKKIDVSSWTKNQSEEWKYYYEDFSLIANNYEDTKYSNSEDFIYFDTTKTIPKSTQTKARNAFNQLMRIKFLTLLLGEVNDLIEEVESNWSLLLMDELERKYDGDIIDEMSDKLLLYFSKINVNHYVDLESIIDSEGTNGSFDGMVSLYKIKNELESKFSMLQYHYETNEVNLKAITQLINKVSDTTLITELKSMQRRLLVEGKISRQVLDDFEQRIKVYIQRLKDRDPSSYTVIELENLLSEKLGKSREMSKIGVEIERIKNEAQVRLCNQELVLLIKAFAQYYQDHPELLQGAE